RRLVEILGIYARGLLLGGRTLEPRCVKLLAPQKNGRAPQGCIELLQRCAKHKQQESEQTKSQQLGAKQAGLEFAAGRPHLRARGAVNLTRMVINRDLRVESEREDEDTAQHQEKSPCRRVQTLSCGSQNCPQDGHYSWRGRRLRHQMFCRLDGRQV